jgi:hypothetical protein
MENYIECGLCGSSNEPVFKNANLIHSGWVLNWLNLGYYAGFTDSIPDDRGYVASLAEYDETPYTVNMCHDCCVKLLGLFPKLAEIAEARGGHYSLSGEGIKSPPCCPYAWAVEPEGLDGPAFYKATDLLTWERQPAAN